MYDSSQPITSSVTEAARAFCVTSFDAVERHGLVAAAPNLRRHGFMMLVVSVLGGALVVALFGWPVIDVLVGAVFGGAIFGATTYFGEVRHEVPRAAALPRAPEDTPVVSGARPNAWLWVVVPVVCALAWLADRWDLGSLFFPGLFVGISAANLVGAVLVGRWERAHGRQVLVGHGSGDPELYAR